MNSGALCNYLLIASHINFILTGATYERICFALVQENVFISVDGAISYVFEFLGIY